MVLVERTHHRSADREAERDLVVAPRHRAQCRLMKDRLGGRGDVPLLGQQPRFERRSVLDHDAIEKIGPQPREADRVRPWTFHQHVDIDHRVRGQFKNNRITLE